jgi:acyl-coenzyme A synthetase/AMP-(fatty) acid ligase
MPRRWRMWMLRGIWGDDERFADTYWSQFAGRGSYFTGVNARYYMEDAIWVLSRAHQADGAHPVVDPHRARF